VGNTGHKNAGHKSALATRWLGFDRHKNVQLQEIEFGDGLGRRVKVRIDGADHGRWTIGAREGGEHSGD
jgi:hypothetical protein